MKRPAIRCGGSSYKDVQLQVTNSGTRGPCLVPRHNDGVVGKCIPLSTTHLSAAGKHDRPAESPRKLPPSLAFLKTPFGTAPRSHCFCRFLWSIASRYADSTKHQITMPPRRLFGPQYLSCFYCGHTTKLRNDGSTTHFRCLSCDADNYRDRVEFYHSCQSPPLY